MRRSTAGSDDPRPLAAAPRRGCPRQQAGVRPHMSIPRSPTPLQIEVLAHDPVRTSLLEVLPAPASPADVVIVDGGRFSPTSPALGLLARAEVVIAVGRPRLEEIQRIPSLAAELRSLRPVVDLVTVGSAPYDPSEMAAHVDLPLLGVVADDPRAADGVRVDGLAGKRLARSDLARSVGAIAGRLAARTALPSSAVAESGGTA